MLNKLKKPNLDIQLQPQQPQHRNTCLDTVFVSVSCRYYLGLAVERRDRSLTLRRQNLSLLQSAAVSSLFQCVADSPAREKLTTVLTRLSQLQCVAVRCSVLQCVAVCCSVMPSVAVCCNTALIRLSQLQCVTVCYSVLQCVASCCSVL